MTECRGRDCTSEAIAAIRTVVPHGKDGVVTTIYQFVEDAPRTAAPYCGPCAVKLAAGLTALTDADLQVSVEVNQK